MNVRQAAVEISVEGERLGKWVLEHFPVTAKLSSVLDVLDNVPDEFRETFVRAARASRDRVRDCERLIGEFAVGWSLGSAVTATVARDDMRRQREALSLSLPLRELDWLCQVVDDYVTRGPSSRWSQLTQPEVEALRERLAQAVREAKR